MLNLITPSVHIDFPRVFKTFEAHELKQARLTVTGLGLYRAFLNGQRIGGDYLTPGFNDYDAYVAARTYDSIVTQSGIELTADPPAVMIGWKRTWSLSRKVSRRALAASSARLAA